MIDTNQNHLKGNPCISYLSVPCNTPTDMALPVSLDLFPPSSSNPFSNDPFAPFGASPFSILSSDVPSDKMFRPETDVACLWNRPIGRNVLNGDSNTDQLMSHKMVLPEAQAPSLLTNGTSELSFFQTPPLCNSEMICPPPPNPKSDRVRKREKVNVKKSKLYSGCWLELHNPTSIQ